MTCLMPCPKCPRVREPVPGDGPLNARVFAIAESPGRDEDAKGRPFVGRTGKEVNDNYLPLAGLRRDDIYFTNAVKCWPRTDRDISPEIVESCAGLHVRQELVAIRPEVVLLLGAVACSLAGLDVELHHGRPHEAELFGHRALVWPMYHPSLGMHDYSMMVPIMEDWKALGRYLRGEPLEITQDEYPEPRYERLRTARDVEREFAVADDPLRGPLAIDTEFKPRRNGDIPYCLTFSRRPGTGYLIKAEDSGAVGAFAALVDGSRPVPVAQFKDGHGRNRGGAFRGHILLHNAMADHPVLGQMGISLPWGQVRDTMVMAYNLATMPQSLKTLAYRLCGMEMREFNDVVTPYAVSYWLAYIESLATVQWPKPEPYIKDYVENITEEVNGIPVVTGKHVVQKLYKPQGLTTKIKRLLTDYRKNPGPEVFQRWWSESWTDEEKAPAIAMFGDMPEKSIAMVSDESDLLRYACRDADATLRIYPKLVDIRKSFRREHNV